jgi:erythromycin esterase-like protein
MPRTTSFHKSVRCPRLSSQILAALTLLAGIAGAPVLADPPNPGHFDNLIAPGLYRLDGVDPTLPGTDLEPLRRVVGSAHFVGVGEAFHTSGGYYLMKHRVFRYLVEEMGFRVIAWESPFEWGEALESYLQGCATAAGPAVPPEEAIEAVFTVFRSTETRDMAEWMCGWNQQHPHDPVHSYNFDIQRQSLSAANALISFLQRLGVDEDHPDVQGILACDGVVDTFFPVAPFPAERFELCDNALDNLWARFVADEREIVRRTSRDDLALARIQLEIEQAWQHETYSYFTDIHRTFEARDAGMAYLAIALRELYFPHEKVMLWAHNGHLIRDTFAYNGFVGGMGEHLDAELGRDYVAIGQAAYETSTDWATVGLCGVQDILLEPSIEGFLHDLDEPFLLLDLDPRGSHPGFLDPDAVYSIGGSDPLILRTHYDAVLYQDVSPKMDPLAWPSCQ